MINMTTIIASDIFVQTQKQKCP